MKHVVVVGSGILGTMHAYKALASGYSVTHVERDMEPASASVRNFGLIWVSGREAGHELDLALRARQLWEEIGNKTSIGFRPNGSLTVAVDEREFAVMESAASMPDADKRGFEILKRDQVRTLEPLLQGKFYGALHCTQDAVVEPNLLLKGLRTYLQLNENYQWIPNFEVVDFSHGDSGNHITNVQGDRISGDYLILTPGAAHAGFLTEFLENAPIRKVHLQMGATAQISEKLYRSIADADSFRYYPGFKDLALDQLHPQEEIAKKYNMQLLLAPRLDGSFTIGDTHEYVEPFTHEILEAPYDHLSQVISRIFGRNFAIAKRWSGVYSQSTSKDIYFRKEIAPGAVIVTGAGGRGNTLSPAIAEETFTLWNQ